jgi:hypothetical protein
MADNHYLLVANLWLLPPSLPTTLPLRRRVPGQPLCQLHDQQHLHRH